MLIIAVSFTVLAAIISSMMQSYSDETTLNTIQRVAQNVKVYIDEGFYDSEKEMFRDYITENSSDIVRDITTLAMFTNDSLVIITDEDGNIILSTDKKTAHTRIPDEIFDEMNGETNISRTDTLGDILEVKHSYYAVPVYSDDSLVGSIFACASAESLNNLATVMIKTIVMASLWVLLAALIAVYFITEKIIGPLKDMGKAAKSFATGHFDVRVPVVGHDEVAELATAFNNMASSLENYENTRRTFLANVSHDLRSPMFTIGGYIDGILAGAIPPEEQRGKLEIIASEVRRLSRLVSTLLDISRIQAGDRKFTKEPFDICEMARQILISLEQRLDSKKLDVEFECDADRMYVLADRDAIYQIFYNICDNAVKFSREGGKYRISITVKDKRAVVSVYDEGQGIAADDIPHVFDRFYKADKSRGLDKTGTGLGMFIAKTIIDAHEEEIWVNSEEGNYCEFCFTIRQSSEQAYKQFRLEAANAQSADVPSGK